MKHVLFLLWFPIALLIYWFLVSVFQRAEIFFLSNLNESQLSTVGLLEVIVAIVIIGELTWLLYKNLYKKS